MEYDDVKNNIAELFTAPRDFLKMNLLVMIGKVPTVGGVYNFTFKNQTNLDNWTCSRKSKHWWKYDYKIHVWEVRWDKKGNSSAAYFLPYKPDSVQKGTLPADASLMLTAGMTGCTFGVARFKGGQIDVCHANYQIGDRLDDKRMSQETAFCNKRFSDRDYRQQIKGSAVADVKRQGNLAATMIGTNHPRQGWKIYAQQWEILVTAVDAYNYLDLIEL
jgi:hypothetical protein